MIRYPQFDSDIHPMEPALRSTHATPLPPSLRDYALKLEAANARLRRVNVALCSVIVVLMLALAMKMFVGPAAAHDIYTGWKNSKGIDCCGDRDCYRIDGASVVCDPAGCTVTVRGGDHPYLTGDGPRELRFEGQPGWSPDGQTHVCLGGWQGDPFIRCLFVGGTT